MKSLLSYALYQYLGKDCETFVPCSMKPCQNGATCTDVTTDTIPENHNNHEYMCTCTADYTGYDCDVFIPCSVEPCLNGGACLNNDDYSGYTCTEELQNLF